MFKTSSLPKDDSRAADLAECFRPYGPEAAPRMARAVWRSLSVHERAAVSADWLFWARSKQKPPAEAWRTWGFLTARAFGKTWAVSHFVNDEVEAGRATLIGLAAQDEDNSVALQVNGPSGLIATAPPWNRPELHSSNEGPHIIWPNGAKAYVRTPEVPGKIRGLEYHLSWICELQSWPNATRQEAFDNFFLSTRLGYARIVWDATPKKRHPLLKELLAQHDTDPHAHHIVRGHMLENAANLGEGFVDEMIRKFGGTTRGKEELEGLMLEDSELALVKQETIDTQRRNMPSFLRRVVSIDPAVTNRKGSDTTGLIAAGLGVDGRGYVTRDGSGKLDVAKWAETALDWYVADRCDLVLAETNKGGQLVVQNLRAVAKDRGLEVIVIGREERAPQWQPGKVFVREVYARGAKEDRAEPVATAYERGRVSHVIGCELSSLEDTLTTWEPAPNADSPGDLDALVHAMVELLDLSKNEPDPRQGFKGIGEVAKQILAPAPAVSLSRAISIGRSVDRI